MKKETRTGLLIAIAVLGVWIYVEVEPVLSQNGGNNLFSQFQNNGYQQFQNNSYQDQPHQQPSLVPSNFLGDNIRNQQYSQGTMSMPNSLGQPLPSRQDQIMMGSPTQEQLQYMPSNQFGGGQPMQMPPQQNQGGFKGMLQNFFNSGQQQQPQQQLNPMQQMPQQDGMFGQQMQPNDNGAMMQHAVSAVQQELSIAANNASQAEAYRSEAISNPDKGGKQRAASQARYFAGQAQAAAARAQSKAMGVPQAMSLVGQVQAQASRAQSAADSASSYGW